MGNRLVDTSIILLMTPKERRQPGEMPGMAVLGEPHLGRPRPPIVFTVQPL